MENEMVFYAGCMRVMQQKLSIPVVDHLKQQHGFVHGGAISYLADNGEETLCAIAQGTVVAAQ
jgi:acyl-coenzyme A thioesterase PaaI-like protein